MRSLLPLRKSSAKIPQAHQQPTKLPYPFETYNQQEGLGKNSYYNLASPLAQHLQSLDGTRDSLGCNGGGEHGTHVSRLTRDVPPEAEGRTDPHVVNPPFHHPRRGPWDHDENFTACASRAASPPYDRPACREHFLGRARRPAIAAHRPCRSPCWKPPSYLPSCGTPRNERPNFPRDTGYDASWGWSSHEQGGGGSLAKPSAQ